MDKKILRPHKHLQTKSCFILPLFPHLPQVPLISPSTPPSPVPMCNKPTLHFFPHSKAHYLSPQFCSAGEAISPSPFNAIFFNFIFLCFLPDPFTCRNPFSLLSLSSSTQTTRSLSGDCLPHPEASQSSGNSCLPLRGTKTNVAGERSLHLERTAPPSKPALCSSGGCIQRRYLAFNSPERFFSSWYLSNCFSSSNKISHTKSSGKKFCSLTRSYKNCSISLLSNCTYMPCLVLFNCY